MRIITVRGNDNVIGDSNRVNTMNLNNNNEELIRDEAKEFSVQIENYFYISGGHKEFLSLLKQELYNYYGVESKMIFLDQVRKEVVEHAESALQEGVPDILPYKKMLFFVEQEINELPKIIQQSSSSSSTQRTKVFFSYCHKDKVFLDDFKRHLRPLERQIEFWDDSRIDTGKKWREEIQKALEEAKIGVLFVSADFLNSDFILNDELPKLLKLAESEGGTIITVVLKPCAFDLVPEISQYQAFNDPSKPISMLNENDKEVMWVELVKQIKVIVDRP